MDMTYSDIYMLLQGEPQAKAYFDSLPKSLQAQLARDPGRIRSLDQLRAQGETVPPGPLDQPPRRWS